jgi:hypothetical protein
VNALANLRATFRGLSLVQARADAMVAGESPARGGLPVALKQRPHDDLCVFCQTDPAEKDQPYCRPCAVDLAHDLAIDEEITHYGPYGREEE